MTAARRAWRCGRGSSVLDAEHALHIGQCGLESFNLGFHLGLPLIFAIEQRLQALVDDALEIQARAATAAVLAILEVALDLAVLARLACASPTLAIPALSQNEPCDAAEALRHNLQARIFREILGWCPAPSASPGGGLVSGDLARFIAFQRLWSHRSEGMSNSRLGGSRRLWTVG